METRKIIEKMEKYFMIVTDKQKQAILEYWGEEIPEELIKKLTLKELMERIIKTM